MILTSNILITVWAQNMFISENCPDPHIVNITISTGTVWSSHSTCAWPCSVHHKRRIPSLKLSFDNGTDHKYISQDSIYLPYYIYNSTKNSPNVHPKLRWDFSVHKSYPSVATFVCLLFSAWLVYRQFLSTVAIIILFILTFTWLQICVIMVLHLDDEHRNLLDQK